MSLALARYLSCLRASKPHPVFPSRDIQMHSPLLRFSMLVNADFVNSRCQPRMAATHERRDATRHRDKCKGSFTTTINRIGCKLRTARHGTNLARNSITIRIGFLRVQPLTPDRSAVNKARRTGFAICLIHPRLNGLPALRFSGPF